MGKPHYQPLLAEHEREEKVAVDLDITDRVLYYDAARRYRRNFNWAMMTLGLSLLCNIGFIGMMLRPYTSFGLQDLPSEFAGLTYGESKIWAHGTEYSDTKNLTAVSELWQSLDSDAGAVALPHEYAEKHGLPKAQPFPWDPSKGLFFLNSYHNLHCLKSVHLSIVQFSQGREQSFPLGHVMHCLDTLRLETMCHADDSPRRTDDTDKPNSGENQARKCRDWGKLEAWAKDNTACYRRISQAANKENQFERFKFCPEGHPYQKVAEEYFDKNMDHSVYTGIGW